MNTEQEVVEEKPVEESIADALDDVLGAEEVEEKPDEQAPVETGETPPAEEEGTPPEEQEASDVGGGGEGDESGGDEPLDYSVPEGLNERSTDRFNKLVEDNKSQRELVTQHEETLNGMRQLVVDSGLTNEEYLGAIRFASDAKRDPEVFLKRTKELMIEVAKTHGLPLEFEEVDFLDDFPDLKTQVEDMELTKAAAMELASSRRQKAASQKQQQAAQETTNKETEYKSAQDAAIVGISHYLADVQKNDIDWEAKSPIMLEAATYARDNLHPSQWKAHLENEYKRINRIAKIVRPKRTETPLTESSSARGGNKVPSTIEEALDQLL